MNKGSHLARWPTLMLAGPRGYSGYSPPPPPPSSPPLPEPPTVLVAVGTPAEQDTIMVTELAVELKVTRAVTTGPRITVPAS